MKKACYFNKLFGVVYCAVILLLMAHSVDGQTKKDVIQEIEAMQWITEQYPPFNYRDAKNKQVKGIAVDVLMAMFDRLGVNLTQKDLKLQPWARGYQTALKKPGTALFSTTYTEERNKLFKFVYPILPTRVSLIAKKSRNLKIKSAADMNGLKIGVIRNDIGDLLVRALGVDDKALTAKASVDNLVQMLYRDRLDAIAYAEDIVSHQSQLVGFDPNAFEPIYLLKESHMGYAFHMSTEGDVIDTLQKALDALWEDGTVDRIREKDLKK